MQEFQIRKKLKTAQKQYENYSVKLPSRWWYSSDTYNNSVKPDVKILPFEKPAAKKSAKG